MRDWICPGSKIIITTRNEGFLKANEVYKVHRVKELDHCESLQLFSWHAFKQDYPIEANMKHSERVVQYCRGLPLALKVLGSSLFAKSIEVWENAIKKLEAIPNIEIIKILQISYDSLQDDHDQRLFLHIACFFIGEGKDFTVKILSQCEFYPTIGIQNLIDRCLLTIEDGNKLMMHQLIREMGQEIIRQESPLEPGERSRLWRHKDSFDVLKEKTGTKKIEGLILDLQMLNEEKKNKVNLETDAFAKMQKLKILLLSNVQLNGCFKRFPERLKWLRWHRFPLKILPSDFHLESLVVLDLSYSSLEQVWQGTKFIGGLKILNLSHCHNLVKTPDLSGLLSLESLILNDCVSLVQVHESIENLERLVFLNLKDCKNLRKLPKNFGMLKFLETLDMSGCSNLVGSSKVLDADGVVINWPTFNWFWALMKPRRSPTNFTLPSLPRSLVTLSLADCNLSDDAFPRDLGNLCLLKTLDLKENPICNLPDFVKGLNSLRFLDLSSCTSLQSLPGLPNLTVLDVADCISLERITYQSTLSRLLLLDGITINKKVVEIEGFFKLESISEVDVEMINSMGLFYLKSMGDIEVKQLHMTGNPIKKGPIQGLHEFGIFSTFVPRREISSWFSDNSSGSSISFVVPLQQNLRIRGLNVCFVYSCSLEILYGESQGIYTKISNETKNLHWIYRPICHGVPEDNEDMVWLSHWRFGNQLQGGDQVHISVTMGYGYEYQVKECGVDFVYDDEQEEKRSYLYNTDISCEQVIGGDLSRYQVHTGAYFLSHLDESDREIDNASDESDDVNDESDDDGDPYNVYRTRRAFKESLFSIVPSSPDNIGEDEAIEILRKHRYALVQY